MLALCAAFIWMGVHAIICVICGVIASYAIFVAALLATEGKVRHPRDSAHVHPVPIGRHLPPTI